LSKNPSRGATAVKSSSVVLFPQQPALQLIYDTAPIGLACLSPDCRYLQINQRLTEICGISVEDHLGRSVRDCVPALADAVEGIVHSIMDTGDPVIGIEVAGQRADQIDERFWITYWHPLRSPSGEIVAVNVAAEEITERKRAEAALQASEQETRRARDAAKAALLNLQETQDSLIEAEKNWQRLDGWWRVSRTRSTIQWVRASPWLRRWSAKRNCLRRKLREATSSARVSRNLSKLVARRHRNWSPISIVRPN
jgi:PAS domain S-box-containing protein